MLEAVALEVLPGSGQSRLIGKIPSFLPEQAGIVNQQWTLFKGKIISPLQEKPSWSFPVQKQRMNSDSRAYWQHDLEKVA